VVDVGLGALVAVLVLAAAWFGIGPAGLPDAQLTVTTAGIAVALAAALGARRRWPFAVAVAVNVGTLGWFLADGPGRLVTLVPMIALYTVTAHRGWRWGLGAVAVTGATMALIGLTGVPVVGEPPPNPEVVFTAFMIGLTVRYRRELADAVRGRLVREAQAREAEQRLRIAQEVHDIVGHAMATISVQAGVAIHVIEQRPAQAIEALTAIKKISDEGLADIKSVLSDVPRTPVGLDQLEELVDATSAAGPRVELTVRGRRPLPAAVDLAAYRIVQESLTNALRHAQASAVLVRLDYTQDTLTIRVRDDGVGGPAKPAGRGITGMRRRVAALSGQFTAGPGPDGGFEVCCELPT
jgi:signal transduction histidine kinase